MKVYHKGQSSVEYLGTYAWAFVGLLVTLGAMSYFGVFNPNTYTSENCQSGSQIMCVDYAFITNNQGKAHILFEFKNNFARDIVIHEFELHEPFEKKNEPAIIVEAGRRATMSLVGDHTVSPGDLQNMRFTINYSRHKGEQSYELNGTGLIEAIFIPFSVDASDSVINSEPFCGDGLLDPNIGQLCGKPTMNDNNIAFSNDCEVSYGQPPQPTVDHEYACRSDCSCYGYCGDGIVQESGYGTEECEVDADCESTQNCVNCACVSI